MKTPEQLIKKSKHFCILPWIHFHAWPDKKVLPCCVSDSDYPISEIKEDETILQMMNSHDYKDMRVKMLNDEPWEPCNRCYELEDLGTWTMRQSQNMVRGIENLEVVEDTNEDGSLDDFKLRYMDIRFSNLCNFKCRSCGPACSNKWGDEKLKEMDGDKDVFTTAFRIKDTLVSNTDDNNFMEKLKEQLPNVSECYFAGGEILVQPQHYECLDFWVNNDLCDQVHLNYTTNMSKLQHSIKGRGDVNLFDYWEKFPEIEIWASIDDIGDRAEIIRSGTNWDRVISNLKSIKKNAPHVKLGFTPTMSLWNVWNYDKLFETLYQEGVLDLNIPPRMNILTKPDWAKIENMPEHLAWPLIERYENLTNKFEQIDLVDNDGNPRETQPLRNSFYVLLTALKSAKGNATELKEFINQNQRIDNTRKEDIVDIIPELEELFQWAMDQDS